MCKWHNIVCIIQDSKPNQNMSGFHHFQITTSILIRILKSPIVLVPFSPSLEGRSIPLYFHSSRQWPYATPVRRQINRIAVGRRQFLNLTLESWCTSEIWESHNFLKHGSHSCLTGCNAGTLVGSPAIVDITINWTVEFDFSRVREGNWVHGGLNHIYEDTVVGGDFDGCASIVNCDIGCRIAKETGSGAHAASFEETEEVS